jgi:hypothetical protein
MKDDHLAFAQGTLFGDDKRVMNQAEIVKDVCEKMPYGYSRKEFLLIAGFICWFRYSTFPRFMSTALANHKTMTVDELAAELAAIKGDFPNPETIQREIRLLLEKRPDLKAKTRYQTEQVLKRRKDAKQHRNRNRDQDSAQSAVFFQQPLE